MFIIYFYTQHRDHRAETYTSLVKDLTAGVNSDRLKVKIILAWMSKQNIGRLLFGPKLPAPDTPNGYMMLIQEGKGTFPVFFTLLCRFVILFLIEILHLLQIINEQLCFWIFLFIMLL